MAPSMATTHTAMKIDARSRLIVALDIPNSTDARRIVDGLEGSVDFFKVGLELYTATGMDFVRQLLDRKKRVFLDLKFYDVGETVKRSVKVAAESGVDFLTVHGNREILLAAAEGRGTSKLQLLAVTVLTNLDTSDIRDMGYECPVEQLVLWRATKAMEAGCDGVISSPREARQIKEATQNKLLVVTPGIRPLGAGLQDHKRSADPKSAIENGSDYLVVGRPITGAPDPKRAAEEIIAEMQRGFDSK